MRHVASTHLLVADNPSEFLAYPALGLGVGGTITGLSLSLVSDKVQLHVKGR